MKFAFITPRYGGEIVSGVEHACRLLAEQVCERHDVDVLTTCAIDPATWKNEISEGSDRMRGVLVRRFAVAQPHDHDAFQQLTTSLLAGPRSRAEELEWVRQLGPVSPGLLDHLKRQHRSYDALVFFSLWHPTTVQGLQVAADRSILFPYLQLRPVLRFGLWADVLSSPRGIGYFSSSERRLLRSYVRVMPQHEEIVGIGIEAIPQQTYPRHQQDPADDADADDESGGEPSEEPSEPTYLEGRGIPFRRRHRLYGRFAVYVGRVAPDNGSEEMLEYFDSGTAARLPDAAAVDREARLTASADASASGRNAMADDSAASTRDTTAPDREDVDRSVRRPPLPGGFGDPARGRRARAESGEAPALDLVLTGIKMMKVPDDARVRLAGVLPDRERMIAYEAADLSPAPASDDLLSQPLLESLAVGTPVLANAANEAAVEHCRLGNAGLYYANREEFAETLRVLATNNRLRRRLGENGRKYIRQNYRWEAVLGRFDRLISKVRR